MVLVLVAVQGEPARADQSQEIRLDRASAYASAQDWEGAERLLRAFLADHPNHVRGRELLAWVLEGLGLVDEELRVRAGLAEEDGPGHGERVVGYARALERTGDHAHALERYEQAHALGIPGLAPDIERMALRVSPELATGFVLGADPTGGIARWHAGASVPLGARLRIAMTGSHTRGITGGGFERSTIGAHAVMSGRTRELALGVMFHDGVGTGLRTGANASVRARYAPGLEVHAAGEVGMPWLDAAVTARQGGEVDSLGVNVYATALGDLIVGAGVRTRRLSLMPPGGTRARTAHDVLGVVGLDMVMWRSPTRVARGEVLDAGLVWPSPLAAAFVISYRHYEAAAQDRLGPDLRLPTRSSVDEISTVLRQVFDHGAVAVEFRGGAGVDRIRDILMWRVGANVAVSTTDGSRLLVAFDTTSEDAIDFIGRRHAGTVTFHVDL